MNRDWLLGGAVLASLLGGSCITVGGSFRKYGLDRAAFEMECPKEQLTIVGLNRGLDDQAHAGSQVGVTGCGKRMVFVVTQGAGWVANSASK